MVLIMVTRPSQQLNSYSRLLRTPEIIYNGRETFDVWSKHRFLTEEVDSGVFVVSSGYAGRPDKISAVLYGTPYLDWVLIAYNNPLEPFGWPASGSIIRYPLDSEVFPSI
jgi:hypothetical protein